MLRGILTNPHVEGILTNILSLILVGSVVASWYLARRRRLLSFFGLHARRRIILYASRLDVDPGGARGSDGLPRNYRGPAIPEYEARIIADVQGFFARFAPRIVRHASGPLLRWGDIEVEATVAPASSRDIRLDGTLLTVGSPAYNLVSGYAEDRLQTQVRFAADNSELRTRAGAVIGDAHHAFVQRAFDKESGTSVFYVAGANRTGTAAAVGHPLRDWPQMSARYPQNVSFCEVLRVTGPAEYTVTLRLTD